MKIIKSPLAAPYPECNNPANVLHHKDSEVKMDKNEKVLNAVIKGYFHWDKKYTRILGFILVVALLIGRIAEIWQVGAGFGLFLTLFALPDYLPWNSAYNKYLGNGKTEEEIGYLLRGKKRPIKVLKNRPSEPADFRRFHFSRKYTAMMVFIVVVSGIIARIAGAWWLFLPYLVVATPCLGLGYLQWNGMIRDWLKRGYTEVEARETVRDIERSAAAEVEPMDVIFDPVFSSIPGNIYHKH